MEFLCSFLRLHLVGKPVVASPNVGCFLRLAKRANEVPVRIIVEGKQRLELDSLTLITLLHRHHLGPFGKP